MKVAGDGHRQQALFGDESEFVEESKPRTKRKTRSHKKVKTDPKLSLAEKIVAEEPFTGSPKGSALPDENQQYQPHQLLNDDDWDEVQISLAEEVEPAQEAEASIAEVLRPAKKQHWWLRLTAFVAFLLITVEGVSLANLIWQERSWHTGLYGALFVLIFGGFLLLLFKESRKLSQLSRVEEKQTATVQIVEGEPCDDIERYCHRLLPALIQPEVKEAVQQWQELLNDVQSDQDVLRLYEQVVLKVCDEKAKVVIQKWSGQAAVMVAISPLVSLDMLLIAWRNIRMIDEIAACYGVELGWLSRMKLLRLVIYNLIYAGSTELVLDLGLQSVGADLAGKFSARAAQGLGAGLLSARLGVKAMQLCRPIGFIDSEAQPKISHIAKGLRQTLLQKAFKKR